MSAEVQVMVSYPSLLFSQWPGLWLSQRRLWSCNVNELLKWSIAHAYVTCMSCFVCVTNVNIAVFQVLLTALPKSNLNCFHRHFWFCVNYIFAFIRPSPVVAKLKLTTKSKTPATDVLRPLLTAVKSGLLKSSIDGIPVSFKISEAGFRFVTSRGKCLTKLVQILVLSCPRHNYSRWQCPGKFKMAEPWGIESWNNRFSGS